MTIILATLWQLYVGTMFVADQPTVRFDNGCHWHYAQRVGGFWTPRRLPVVLCWQNSELQ